MKFIFLQIFFLLLIQSKCFLLLFYFFLVRKKTNNSYLSQHRIACACMSRVECRDIYWMSREHIYLLLWKSNHGNNVKSSTQKIENKQNNVIRRHQHTHKIYDWKTLNIATYVKFWNKNWTSRWVFSIT